LSAAVTFLNTCSLCARMSPLPTTLPPASQLTCPEMQTSRAAPSAVTAWV
jgi:hypothetical protein